MILRKGTRIIHMLAFLALILCIAVSQAGCSKKEDAETAQTEVKKEAGHEAHEKENADTVTLSPEKQKSAGLEVGNVARENIAVPLSATAAIEMNMDNAAKISPRVAGKVVRIVASQGDRVKAGQPLAYIDSIDLDQTWSDYIKAKGRVELARRNLAREESLFEKKISPEKDVLRTRQELGEAEADMNFAKERFRLFGVDISHFESPSANGHHPLIPVTTPAGGIVVEKAVTLGEMINSEKTLFTIADLSTLWGMIDVYEKDISRLRPGTAVKVSVTAFPEKVFRGRVSYIGDVIDEKTRTEKARVTIDNSSGLLKPGMFATVMAETAGGGTERLIAVPEDAVLVDGNSRYVFVQTAPEKFKRRDVEAGRTLGNRVEVIRGLTEGDAIAVKGAFILKSELKKGELEGDAH